MPYLINENLDKDPVTKEKLYSEKFMGRFQKKLKLLEIQTRSK